ncbi:SPOR domain-containing protein [Allohahella marinimesophila]|uniref:SPOR domain-containing protein n=1 Tax=Allohahella marinimesophila TaxID=1054972 RepID=A0ABP7NVK7_9GAMM
MTSFKTRVIGAVILVSLAIIFVPMLFKSPADQPGQVETPQSDSALRSGSDRTPMTDADPRASQRLEVPPTPEVPEFTIEEPAEPELRYSDRAADLDAGQSAVEARGSDDFEIERPTAGEREPPTPAAEQNAQPASAPREAPAAQPVERTASAPATPRPAAEKPAAPAGSFGEAWSIQVGSFSDQERAQTVRADLQKEGTAAYVQEVQLDNGSTMVRVYAGPMLERSTAEKLKVTLDKKFGVNSLIMRYRPVQP